MASKQRIIVGIDFGTTYSGVAWADSTSPREITPIRQWPDAESKQDMDKVPSEMLYESDGSFKWGFQASTDSAHRSGNVLQYMKLLLDPSQQAGALTDYFPDPLGLAQTLARLPENKKPVDVIADYLREIRLHALKVLSKRYGTDFWKVIDMEYHLTIPAVWSESARALTLIAANQAGIGTSQDLLLISEPEAAALYCLSTDIAPELLKTGDTFVVVDCGGGTIDLVSYKILKREPTLEIKEIAVGGGLCGSVFLNRRFENFMRMRLGKAITEGMVRRGRPYWRMKNEFEKNLKRKFKLSKENNVMDCPVSGVLDDEERRIQDGYMEISREEMEGIFEPVITHIIQLIQEQLDSVLESGHQPVSAILLVGGFGSSPYLCMQVEKYIQNIRSARGAGSGVANDAIVLQPANAWSAIVRGAVICGLQTVEIQSRKARRNYGVKYREIFDPSNSLHTEESKVWCSLYEQYMCSKLMKWYVRKGDEVAATMKFSFPFNHAFWKSRTDPAVFTLYASNSHRDQAETYCTHENVYPICEIRCDLTPLYKRMIQKTTSGGENFYVLECSIVMQIHSAQLTFGVEYNGQPCGATATATFV